MLGFWRSYCNQFFGRAIPLIFAIFVCALLSSCMTAAQRLHISFNEDLRPMNACNQKIETNPAYQSIAPHWPYGSRNATLVQLADTGIPSDKDVEVIIALNNEQALCRALYIEITMKYLPGAIPALTQYYHSRDLILVDLIQHKITWGEANKRILTHREEFDAKSYVAWAEAKNEESVSRYAEQKQRQDALNALSQWSYQQQLLMQNRQLINSLNRPVITNCSRFGNSISCTSH